MARLAKKDPSAGCNQRRGKTDGPQTESASTHHPLPPPSTESIAAVTVKVNPDPPAF